MRIESEGYEVNPVQGDLLFDECEPGGVQQSRIAVCIDCDVETLGPQFWFSFEDAGASLDVLASSDETRSILTGTCAVVPKRYSSVLQDSGNRGQRVGLYSEGFIDSIQGYDLVLYLGALLDEVDPLMRRQLLHNTCGSLAVVRQMIRKFQDNRSLGLAFPAYHSSSLPQMRRAIGKRVPRPVLRLSQMPDRPTLASPSGSVFWVRPAALCALNQLYSLGETDSSLMHQAYDMFLTNACVSAGYSYVQTGVDVPFSLTSYYTPRRPYVFCGSKPTVSSQSAWMGKKIAVCTAVFGDYDSPVPPEIVNTEFDYLVFSDTEVETWGVWKPRVIDYWNVEPARMARYVKTHLPLLLKGYDYAIWVDSNVVLRTDMNSLLGSFDESHFSVGAIVHPLRDCTFDEAHEVLQQAKASEKMVRNQMARYRTAGFDGHGGLHETGLLVLKLREKAVASFCAQWWSELERYSTRDQLCFDYLLWRNQLRCQSLFEVGYSLRDHPEFGLVERGANSGLVLCRRHIDMVRETSAVRDPLPLAGAESMISDHHVGRAIDIVVCVHNALSAVKRCMRSLIASAGVLDRIFVVDDASARDTQEYLSQLAASHSCVSVVRNDVSAGYTASANLGFSLGNSPYVLLVNSDTILPPACLQKMSACMTRNEHAAVVGPLSNAAGAQSVPNVKSSRAQTAVNELPSGFSPASMDSWCEDHFSASIDVQLLHGFCMLIRRCAIESEELFDDSLFPRGYGEENDLCFRLADEGWLLKIETSAFVYHEKSQSFRNEVERERLMRQGAAALRSKYGSARLDRAIISLDRNPVLVEIRQQVERLGELS